MKIAAVVVGVVVALFITLLAFSPTQRIGEINAAAVGKVAPETTGLTVDGADFDIRDHRGEWVLVNFFATWCTGCIVEHPELVEWHDRHNAGDPAVPPGSVVSVVWDDNDASVREFFERNGGDWPVIVGDGGAIGLRYGVTAVPESYLVAPTGRVVQKFVGASGVTADNIDRSIALLLGTDAETEASGG